MTTIHCNQCGRDETPDQPLLEQDRNPVCGECADPWGLAHDLEAEREKVRVLRDALENLVDRDLIKGDPYLDDYFEEVGDALAATSPETLNPGE